MSSLLRRAFEYLPAEFKNAVLKRHYYHVVRHFDTDLEPDQKIIELLVKPGDHAIDVGANVGVYTQLLAKLVATSGKVLSFEPVPVTFSFLSYTIRKLRMSNVELRNTAVGSVAGTVSMVIPDTVLKSGNIYEAKIVPASESAEQAFEVAIESLDTVASGLTPSFIKVDVEGHELECLRGAARLIQSHRPAMLLEISEDPDDGGSKAAEIFRILSDIGYAPFRYVDARLVRHQPGHPTANYFFLMASHLERVRDAEIDVC